MVNRGKRALSLVIVNSVAMSYWVPKRVRKSILNKTGHSIGQATIFSNSIVRSGRLTVGDASFVNHGVFFDSGDVTLGNGVFVGPKVTFASADHLPGTSAKRAGKDVIRDIYVGNGTWIGAGAVILGGVSIAEGCVIGAGAVVTKSTAPNGLYVGVPAARKADLPIHADPLV